MRTLIAGAVLLMSTGCSAQQCMAPGAQLPDRAKIMANLTGGQPGREAMTAVFSGDIDALRRLVAADKRVLDTRVTVPADFDSRPDGQWGDLMTIAVARCDGEMVHALLDLGASPNGADYGWPLSIAVQQRKPDMAGLAAGRGCRPRPGRQGGSERHPRRARLWR